MWEWRPLRELNPSFYRDKVAYCRHTQGPKKFGRPPECCPLLVGIWRPNRSLDRGLNFSGRRCETRTRSDSLGRSRANPHTHLRWSGQRELNPRPLLGRRGCYRNTLAARGRTRSFPGHGSARCLFFNLSLIVKAGTTFGGPAPLFHRSGAKALRFGGYY